MAKAPSAQESKYGDVESTLASIIVDSEYETARTNNSLKFSDYDAILDMVDGIRAEKDYDWNSDINLPLVISHLLTEASGWTTYFQTRDFVDVYLEGDEENDKAKCAAVKKTLNKTLNMREVYHFHKYIRARMVAWLAGQSYLLCYWEQDIKTNTIPQTPQRVIIPQIGPDGQRIDQIALVDQPDVVEEKIILDRFNYEVLDPRNVYTDTSYCYSIQQKDWIIIRCPNRSYEDLKREEAQNGYFNLELVKEAAKSVGKSKSAEETTDLNDNINLADKTPLKKFDELVRYGKIYAVVEEKNEDGEPIKIRPGYDSQGELLSNAELIEGIVSFATPNDKKILIRFQPTPWIDSLGRPYKPIIRGWSYIHPSKDTGMSDGKNLHDLQKALNDTFNIGNDRVMLATLPVMKARKGAVFENPTIRIAPNHVIELDDVDADLKELTIRDNIAGAMNQIGVIERMASQVDAVWPTTMGGDVTNGTATEVMATEGRTNSRRDLKAFTYEYTQAIELYNMILQMTYRFARPETAIKMMGEELAMVFDPNADYTYAPVSQAIEAEHNKMRKISLYDQMIGRLSGLAKVNPAVIPIIGFMIGKQATMLGSEYQEVAALIENLKKTPNTPEQGAESVADIPPQAASNERGIPMSGMEQTARGMM